MLTDYDNTLVGSQADAVPSSEFGRETLKNRQRESLATWSSILRSTARRRRHPSHERLRDARASCYEAPAPPGKRGALTNTCCELPAQAFLSDENRLKFIFFHNFRKMLALSLHSAKIEVDHSFLQILHSQI